MWERCGSVSWCGPLRLVNLSALGLAGFELRGVGMRGSGKTGRARATRTTSAAVAPVTVAVALALGVALVAGCGGSSSKGAAASGAASSTTVSAPDSTTTTTLPPLDVDALRWARKPGLLPDAGNLTGVVAWKDAFVAVGVDRARNSVAIWTSGNGSDWSKGGDTKDFLAKEFPTDIATDGKRIVITGFLSDGSSQGKPRVWTSEDGSTWTRVAESALSGSAPTLFSKVDANDKGFVAELIGATSVQVASSSDGLVWKRHDAGSGSIGVGDSNVDVSDVIATPSGYLAVGSIGKPADAAVWTSTDGDSWKRAVSASLGGDRFQSADVAVVGGPGFVVGGSGDTGPAEYGAIWSSADARSWTLTPQTPLLFGGTNGSGVEAFAKVGGKLLAAGHASAVGTGGYSLGIWTSADGTTWKRASTGAALNDPLLAKVMGVAATSKAVVVLTRLLEFDATQGRFVVRDLGVYVGTKA